jgi:hypothetical protein
LGGATRNRRRSGGVGSCLQGWGGGRCGGWWLGLGSQKLPPSHAPQPPPPPLFVYLAPWSLAGLSPSAAVWSMPCMPHRGYCGSFLNKLLSGDIRALTNILVHRLEDMSWHIRTAHFAWVQAAGETVRTARSARGSTGTRAGPKGETGGFTRQLDLSLTPGSAHCIGKPRGSGRDSGRTKLPNPRAPPMPSDAD